MPLYDKPPRRSTEPPRRSTEPPRRNTSLSVKSLRKGLTFNIGKSTSEPSPPPKPQQVLKPGEYSTYNLSWPKLKAYLQKKFPNVPFGDGKVRFDSDIIPSLAEHLLPAILTASRRMQMVKDKWVFEIPRSLNSVGSYIHPMSNVRCHRYVLLINWFAVE